MEILLNGSMINMILYVCNIQSQINLFYFVSGNINSWNTPNTTKYPDVSSTRASKSNDSNHTAGDERRRGECQISCRLGT